MTNLPRLVLAMAIVAGTAEQAAAAGFGIEDHLASQMGAANAGAAAAAEDAGTIADNPAGIARLRTAETVVSTVLVNPTLAFTNSGSSLPGGAPTSGPGGDGGAFAVLPNLFFAAPATDRLSLGLGVMPNFGLATTYPSAWVGRYLGVNTKLLTVDIAPTIA
jgi:long-chain fatty acid transport protein